MAKINLDDEAPQSERKLFLVEPDLYTGKITRVSDPIVTKPFKDGGEARVKVVMDCRLDVKSGNEEVTLPFWATLTVVKGGTGMEGKTYSASKLYDVLDKANLLGEFKNLAKTKAVNGVIDDKALTDFLQAYLVNVEAKFDVETAVSKDGTRYSTVKSIKKFLSVPEQEAVEHIDLSGFEKPKAKRK